MKIRDRQSLFIFICTICVFFRASFFSYVWDDHFEIPAIQRLWQTSELWRVWIEPYWRLFNVSADAVYYRPISILSFGVIDSWIGRGYPPFSHSVNVLLHAANTVLLYFVLKNFISSRRVACVLTLLWALHPVTVGSVAFVSGRDTLWSLTFFLLSLFFIFRSHPLGALLPFAFMLFSKESGLFFIPAVLWLLFSDQKTHRKLAIVYVGVTIIFLGMRSYALGSEGVSALSNYSIQRSAQIISQSLWRASAYFKTEGCSGSNFDYIFGLVLIGSFFCVGLFFRKLRPWVLFLSLTLLPLALGSAKVKTFHDRHWYVSTLAWILLFAFSAKYFCSSTCKRVVSLFMVPILFLCAWASYKRLSVWQNDQALFSQMLLEQPLAYDANVGLGVIDARRGKLDEAQNHFEAALVCSPRDSRASMQLAQVFATMGRNQNAGELLKSFSPSTSRDSSVLEGCAKVNLILKRGLPAKMCANQLLLVLPKSAKGYLYRAMANELLGERREVDSDLAAAVSNNLDDTEVWYGAAMILRDEKKYSEALQYLEQAQPDLDSETVSNDIAVLYALKGQPKKALEKFEEALQKYPQSDLLKENSNLLRATNQTKETPHRPQP